MSINLNKNGGVTRPLMVKKIEYPEHKLKNKEGIILEDFHLNQKIIDNTKSFYSDVKTWEKNQHELNSNRRRNKFRQISEEALNNKLDKKEIATSYTLQENSLFFTQKFNNDPNKIREFYEIFLNALLEEANISKNKVINAIIHFDQTNPHLHFSISNIHTKFSKDLNKEVLTVNKNTYHLLDNLILAKRNNKQDYERWLQMKEAKKAYYNHEISDSDWNTYLNKNWDVGLLSRVEQKINQEYERKYGQGLYLSSADKIYMHNLRGFTNEHIKNIAYQRSRTKQYKNMENNIVLTSRNTAIKNELFHFKFRKEPLIKDEQEKLFNEFLTNQTKEGLQQFVSKKYNKEYSKLFLEYSKILSDEQIEALCKIKDIPFEKNKKYYYLEFVLHDITELDILQKQSKNIDRIFEKLYEDKILLDGEMLEPNDLAIINTYSNWTKNWSNSLHEIKDWLKSNDRDFFKLEELKKDWESWRNLLNQYNPIQLENNYYHKRSNELMNKKWQQDCDLWMNKNGYGQHIDLTLSNYESNLMIKKVLRERIDYDLKLLNLYEEWNKNGISRNREYNKILEYCAVKQKEKQIKWDLSVRLLKKHLPIIKSEQDWDMGKFIGLHHQYNIYKKGASYTPQDLAKDMYNGTFEPINLKQMLQKIDKNLSEEQQKLEENKIFNLKRIEYAILQKEFNKEKILKLNPQEEKQEIEESLNYYNSITKSNSFKLGWDAKQINNWYQEQDLDFDIQNNQLNLKNSIEWKNQDIENMIDNRVIQGLELEVDKQKFEPLGIQMDFLKQINDDYLIQSYSRNKDLSIEYQNQSMDNMDLKDNKSINYRNLDSSDFSIMFMPPILDGEDLEQDTAHKIKQQQREAFIKAAISLAKNDREYEHLCQKINIPAWYIEYQVESLQRKNQDMSIDQMYNEMTMKRR